MFRTSDRARVARDSGRESGKSIYKVADESYKEKVLETETERGGKTFTRERALSSPRLGWGNRFRPDGSPLPPPPLPYPRRPMIDASSERHPIKRQFSCRNNAVPGTDEKPSGRGEWDGWVGRWGRGRKGGPTERENDSLWKRGDARTTHRDRRRRGRQRAAAPPRLGETTAPGRTDV